METSEDFVTFEQAKALKELGFDWECHYHYETNRLLAPNVRAFYYSMEIDSDDLYIDVNGRNIGDISAPTLSQAAKWLRKVKHIDVIVLRYADDYDYKVYSKDMVSVTEELFETYEQALSAGIDKALELLK